MNARTLHRFSVEDFYQMAETGVIHRDARVELLDGQIVDMTPIGPFHAGTVNRLNRFLSGLSQGRWLLAVQNPLHLEEYSEPQPDLLVLKPSADDYTSRHPIANDVFWLVEVADTTIEFDRREKLPVYGRAGVPEVWLVNLPRKTLEVYREPNFRGYTSQIILAPGQLVSPLAFPDDVFEVAELVGDGK